MSNQCSSLPNKQAAVKPSNSSNSKFCHGNCMENNLWIFFFFLWKVSFPFRCKMLLKKQIWMTIKILSLLTIHNTTTLLQSLLLVVLKCKVQIQRGKVQIRGYEDSQTLEKVAQKQACSIPGSVQDQGGWGFMQPVLLEDNPQHGKGVELDNF